MKKPIIFIIAIIICTGFLGCASFRKKFVREKHKEEQPHPVISFKDYAEDITYHDLYKKHFLYWKYWEMEFIDALGEDNYKKQLLALAQTISNLKSLESYLVPEKELRISPFRQDLDKLESKIKKGFSTSLERLRLKQDMEKHQRMLEKELMYQKMKEFIKTEGIKPAGAQTQEISPEGANP